MIESESILTYEPEVAIVGSYPSPEGVAAGLARISRDATPIPELVQQAIDDTGLARRRNENIIYEYGHSSIAEGAVFGMAILSIPRSLSIDLVSHRLASYTQLSYRYVTLDKVPAKFFCPVEYRSGPSRTLFEKAVADSIDVYNDLLTQATAYLLAQENPLSEAAAIKRATEDARYVLPIAQTTQIGMTANARTWGHVMSRLLSHPQVEGRALGQRLLDVLQPAAPSLFPAKYMKASTYPASALTSLHNYASTMTQPMSADSLPTHDGVTLIDYDPDAETKLAALLLARVTELAYGERAAAVSALSPEDRAQIICHSFDGISAHDTAMRELETVSYTFEMVQSEACYHQLIRHRMTSQVAQNRRLGDGYTIPPLLVEAGLSDKYSRGMDSLEQAFRALGADSRAEIVLGNGHNRRTLLHVNARELIELSRLRTDHHAQWEVRQRTHAAVSLMAAVHPSIGWACGGRDDFKAGSLAIGRSAS